MRNRNISSRRRGGDVRMRLVAACAGLASAVACNGVATDSSRQSARADSGSGHPLIDASAFTRDRTCKQNVDCKLVRRSCCPDTESTLNDVLAVQREEETPYLDALGRACGHTVCSLVNRRNYALLAACVDGSCTAVDISTAPSVTGCTQDKDCKLRALSCCACGYVESIIAISSESAYDALACTGECPQCDGGGVSYRDGLRAYCNHGTCAVAGP